MNRISFKRAWLSSMTLTALLMTACGGGGTSAGVDAAAVDSATPESAVADVSLDTQRPNSGALTVAQPDSDLAHIEATTTPTLIKITTVSQLDTAIVSAVNARVVDYAFNKSLIKSLVAGRLTVSIWTKAYGTGTITTSTGVKKLCDGVCPGGSQFDDWLTYVLDNKTMYYEISTSNVTKVPTIVSDILKKYSISLTMMSAYMDTYYKAWSPNGGDIRLDWRTSSGGGTGGGSTSYQRCWVELNYMGNEISRYCQPYDRNSTCTTRYYQDMTVEYGPTCT